MSSDEGAIEQHQPGNTEETGFFSIDDAMETFDAEQARAFFVDEFHRRSVWARELEAPCYTLPFTYILESERDDDIDFHGGLWIPSAKTQRMVHEGGVQVHWSLGEDLADNLWDKGILTYPPFLRGILDFSEAVPVAKLMPDAPLLGSAPMREAVEADYGVIVRSL